MKRTVLIYDGDCNFCKQWVNWALKRNAANHLEFLSCQSEERQQRFPKINEIDCKKAMYVALPNQRILSGGDAVPYFLAAVDGWKWSSYLFKIPCVPFIVRPMYRFIARHRHRLNFGSSVCHEKGP